ncbi:MAG: DUF4012 domain-containing protein [Candidatus Levybacteria bacterium]|nr:DUF4012 domain-containing protein [Candidatus Levybacteria bacterium]
MPQLFDIEEKENNIPILCIFGDSHLLEKHLVEENANKFRIILISQKKPSYLDDYPQIYFIPYEKANLLPKLEETLTYAIAFLSEKNAQYSEALLQKLEADKSKSLLVITVTEIQKVTPHVLQWKRLPSVRIAVLGELMTRKKCEGKAELSKIIENAILNGEIRLNGEEILPVYGITISDALLGIGRLLFGNFKTNVVYYLFYKHPETVLESAHLIGRVEPDIQIIFTNEINQTPLPKRGELKQIVTNTLHMAESYIDTFFEGFEKGVEGMFAEILETPIVEKKIKKSKFAKTALRARAQLKFVTLSFLFGGFLFLFVNLLFFGIGLLLLKSSISNIQSNNFPSAKQHAVASRFFLSVIKPTIELTFDAIGFLDQNGNLQKTYSLAERSRELIEIAGTTVGQLINNKQLTEQKITSSVANLSFLYQEGQRIALETDNKSLTKQLKETYSKILSLSEVLPQIAGFDQERTYLLLFQNNDELRPNGGFIGSIGELTVKDGKISKISIQDVYELDGQLKNHIEPPFVVRRYLQPHLYLRDSNFYLNFQETASTSAKIYNLETGKEPDGVVAINLRVLQEIMKISGPITLPSYNVTVSNDTVSQFIQSTIKDNFFPGSTQKKDVLNSVFTQLVDKSANDPKFNIQLLKLIPDMLEQKDIQVAFRDESVQKIFSANSYAGEHFDRRIKNPKVVNDFLYINEANIGVNKANAVVSREVLYSAMLGEGILSSKLSLLLTNNSPSDDYTTYLQIVTPQGSKLKKITINGVVQSITTAVVDPQVYESPDFIKPEGLEVEQFNKDQFTYFAFIAVGKKGEKTQIVVDYENGATKNLSVIIDYSLLYIKQPGTQPYTVTTSIAYPEDYSPVGTSADSYGKNFLENTVKIEKDYVTNIQLQKRRSKR